MFSSHLSIVFLLWHLGQSGAAGQSKFTLKLNNTSPSVMLSGIKFSAFLFNEDGKPVNSKLLKYKWRYPFIGEIKEETITYGEKRSNLSLDEVYLPPSNYTMDVKVFRKINESIAEWNENEEKIAEGKMNYAITENLNGRLDVWQKLDVVTPPLIFATAQNVTFNATISDKFKNASWLYIWNIGTDPKTRITTVPNITLNFTEAGHVDVRVKVIATIRTGWPIITEINSTTELGKHIELRDAVTALSYNGSRRFTRGSALSAVVTCSGSPPFNLTWQVRNATDHPIAGGTVLQDHCAMNFSHVKIGLAGNYTLDVFVKNDVSVERLSVTVCVWVPVDVGLTFFCCLIGFVILLNLLYFYRKDHSMSIVEEADFDFRHYEHRAWPMWEKMKHFFKYQQWKSADPRLLFRRQSSTRSEGRMQFERSESYGSLTSINIV